MLTLGLKAGGPPQSKPKLPVVAVWNDSAGKALFSAQPSKVRLNFRIGCDFSTANHFSATLVRTEEPSEHEYVFDFHQFVATLHDTQDKLDFQQRWRAEVYDQLRD